MRHIHIYGVTFIVANHNKQRWRSISSAFHQTVRAEFLRDLHCSGKHNLKQARQTLLWPRPAARVTPTHVFCKCKRSVMQRCGKGAMKTWPAATTEKSIEQSQTTCPA